MRGISYTMDRLDSRARYMKSDARTKLLPEVAKPKATVLLEVMAKGISHENQVN